MIARFKFNLWIIWCPESFTTNLNNLLIFLISILTIYFRFHDKNYFCMVHHGSSDKIIFDHIILSKQ